jgi:hypothetical protein
VSLPKDGYPLTDTREIHLQINIGPNAWEVEIDDTHSRLVTSACGPAASEDAARAIAHHFIAAQLARMLAGDVK